MTTNVVFMTKNMLNEGVACDGMEQDFDGLHIFPVDYFSPRLTTGEYRKTDNTFCDHLGVNSWGKKKKKPLLLRLAGPKCSVRLIKLKRKIIG